jgi:hypothetical protein
MTSVGAPSFFRQIATLKKMLKRKDERYIAGMNLEDSSFRNRRIGQSGPIDLSAIDEGVRDRGH